MLFTGHATTTNIIFTLNKDVRAFLGLATLFGTILHSYYVCSFLPEMKSKMTSICNCHIILILILNHDSFPDCLCSMYMYLPY